MMKTEDTTKRVSHPCEHRKGGRVGKRSFRRAQQRALREGRALYKGRWYTSTQLSSPTTRLFPTITTKRQKPLLWQKHPGERQRAGRLKVFSWNSGGLTAGRMDEISSWAKQCCYDIVFVQETRWKLNCSWVCGSFYCVHSGEDTKKGNSWCGLMVMISQRIASPSLIRWATLLPGRLMHIRVHDQHGALDLLNCYQQPLSRDSGLQHTREQVWHGIGQVLHRLPLRNRLLMAGDFNSCLHPRPPWIGQNMMAARNHENEPDILGDLIELHDLCALNSWSGRDTYTCATIHGGKSCIDSILTRRGMADPRARQTCADMKCPLLAHSSACVHYPLSGSIPAYWRCWDKPSSRQPVQAKIDSQKIGEEARLQTKTWQAFTARFQEALNTYTVTDVGFMTQQVRQLCLQFFPLSPRLRETIAEDATLKRTFHTKWRLWRELHKCSGAGMGAVFLRWRLVTRITYLSRLTSRRSKHLRRARYRQIFEEATLAAQKNDMKSLFRQVRRLAPKKPRTQMSLRDEHGYLLGPLAEGRKLHGYLRDIFYDERAAPITVPLSQELPIDATQMLLQFAGLHPGKSVPNHCVPPVVWKYLASLLSPWLEHELTKIWTNCTPHVPAEWRSSWWVLVAKPEKQGTQPAHWRPISLQESMGKAVLKSITLAARDFCLTSSHDLATIRISTRTRYRRCNQQSSDALRRSSTSYQILPVYDS